MNRRAAIVGGGVIGGGWAARFLLAGWDVRVFDPDPEAERKIGEVLANARASFPGLYDTALPPEGKLTFHGAMSDAIENVEWVQESVPERLALKRKVYQALQEHSEGVIVASSTSGFKPSELQGCATRPEEILVAHPFNPVYLIPVVELVGTEKNSSEQIARAEAILRDIGMVPLPVRAEIEAHIADRLLEAVWREALWLIKDDIATTQEVDEAIRLGFGLRWAQMGLFETYRIAGGEAGMAHFLRQFGPALEWPWSKLMDVPDLDEALVQKIADQSDAQSGDLSIRDLEAIRDKNLVAILRALKGTDWGAGTYLNAADRARAPDLGDTTGPILTAERAVPQDWTDYNGHMTEARYLDAFADATDRFMEMIGCDADYVAAGHSLFTAETHIRHLDEAHAGTRIRIETLCLEGQGKKMHLFHSMYEGARLLATAEHMLIHVSLETRRAADFLPGPAEVLARVARVHQTLPRPEGVGRAIGSKR